MVDRLRHDAALTSNTFPVRPTITITQVSQIEERLDFANVVSLVFLLYDNAHTALQRLSVATKNGRLQGNQTILSDWARYESCKNPNGNNWNYKLLEALTITQQFQTLKQFGYTKQEMVERYLPWQSLTSVNVNLVYKALYRLCEMMPLSTTRRLIFLLQNNMPDHNYVSYDERYLEMYILDWITRKIIIVNTESINLANLTKILKHMGLENLYDDLRSIEETINQNRHGYDFRNTVRNGSPEREREHERLHPEVVTMLPTVASNSCQTMPQTEHLLGGLSNVQINDPTQIVNTNSSEQSKRSPDLGDNFENGNRRLVHDFQESESMGSSTKMSHRGLGISMAAFDTITSQKYPMSFKNAGICIVINQKNFTWDENHKFKFYMSPQRLDMREGTDCDRNNLNETFSRYGFKMLNFSDLTHTELVPTIENAIANNFTSKHCCLIVCILSHGESGVIFGSDCIPVETSDIENTIQNVKFKFLLGKPKILITQACQGKRNQKAVPLLADDEDEEGVEYNTTDGPSVVNRRSTVPQLSDFLSFYSTVNGFASVRNKVSGSWFIRSLCTNLTKNAQHTDFESILTVVVQDVSQKRWNDECMTPEKRTTFRRKLYFSTSDNLVASAKIDAFLNDAL